MSLLKHVLLVSGRHYRRAERNDKKLHETSTSSLGSIPEVDSMCAPSFSILYLLFKPMT